MLLYSTLSIFTLFKFIFKFFTVIYLLLKFINYYSIYVNFEIITFEVFWKCDKNLVISVIKLNSLILHKKSRVVTVNKKELWTELGISFYKLRIVRVLKHCPMVLHSYWRGNLSVYYLRFPHISFIQLYISTYCFLLLKWLFILLMISLQCHIF